jgi:hypothetical protein
MAAGRKAQSNMASRGVENHELKHVQVFALLEYYAALIGS